MACGLDWVEVDGEHRAAVDDRVTGNLHIYCRGAWPILQSMGCAEQHVGNHRLCASGCPGNGQYDSKQQAEAVCGATINLLL